MSVREENILLEQIDDLLREPAAGAAAPSLARVEDTLTAGYARALALEAERWRLEREVGEVARRIGGGEGADHAKELAALVRKISRTDGRLFALRGTLANLKRRAAEIREASAA